MGPPPYGPWAAVWGSGLFGVGAPWSPFRSQFTAATVLSCSFAVGGWARAWGVGADPVSQPGAGPGLQLHSSGGSLCCHLLARATSDLVPHPT